MEEEEGGMEDDAGIASTVVVKTRSAYTWLDKLRFLKGLLPQDPNLDFSCKILTGIVALLCWMSGGGVQGVTDSVPLWSEGPIRWRILARRVGVVGGRWGAWAMRAWFKFRKRVREWVWWRREVLKGACNCSGVWEPGFAWSVQTPRRGCGELGGDV